MILLTGSTCSRRYLARSREFGWGRLFVGKPRPLPGEPWGLDNGVFSAWKHKKPWDSAPFVESLTLCAGLEPPMMTVLPDIVGGGAASIAFSMRWLGELPPMPWYLAVQNGMTIADVAAVLPDLSGLFLGGTDDFKASAKRWCDLAHEHGKRFHYARVSTQHRLRAALECGADSADSAQMLWSDEHWLRYERWWRDLHAQGSLF